MYKWDLNGELPEPIFIGEEAKPWKIAIVRLIGAKRPALKRPDFGIR